MHNLVYSDTVLKFVEKCNFFMNILKLKDIPGRSAFVLSLQQTLPEMYSGMLQIPVEEAIFDGENEKFVTEEEWAEVFRLVVSILGSQNEYMDIPLDEEYDRMELISRTISEDIADIYQDIRNFLELYRNGTEEIMNDALWECRMNFESYWGEKLLRASLALHRILLKDDVLLDQLDDEWKEVSQDQEINTSEWLISKRQKDFGGESGF